MKEVEQSILGSKGRMKKGLLTWTPEGCPPVLPFLFFSPNSETSAEARSRHPAGDSRAPGPRDQMSTTLRAEFAAGRGGARL